MTTPFAEVSKFFGCFRPSRSKHDEQTRRKPLVFVADAVRYGI